MYESGIYKHIYSRLYPKLQNCEKTATYQSARMPDLTSAFAILLLGIISGVVTMVGECFWKRKQKIYHFLRKNVIHHKPV